MKNSLLTFDTLRNLIFLTRLLKCKKYREDKKKFNNTKKYHHDTLKSIDDS